MATVDDPKTWIPYIPSKDCSQGICSLYCPQWCNIIYPPPPFDFPDDNSSPSFSPLVIAVIGILVSAFLLASYYTIMSKYCGSPNSTRREDHDSNEELEDDHNPTLHEPWHTATTGLDEALIKSITVCKYKKGEGLVEGTDCSVCLSEFQEDESIRLLPKCSHAFHLPCIDKWLKSHSSCPLCRANIVLCSGKPLPSPTPVTEIPLQNETLPGAPHANESVALEQDLERCVREEEIMHSDIALKNSFRAFSDLGNSEKTDTMIEIRDHGGYQHLRRSLSMDLSCQISSPVANILCMNQDEVVQVEESQQTDAIASSSKQLSGGVEKSSNKSRLLHFVMSPIAMKRSFSSRRLLLTRNGRRRHTIDITI